MIRTRFMALPLLVALSFLACMLFLEPARSQDWVSTVINLGAPRVRLAASDFAPRSVDQQLVSLTQLFNQVLWNDLENAGIFDMVSKSYYPLKLPTEPADVVFQNWSNPPASAQMLAFGKTEVINANLVITARLFDVGNTANPSVLGKRYVSTMNELSTREAAHRFANEIIQALGGGVPGINLTRIAFVSDRSGHPEIWVMDYDGFNQRPITSYSSTALTPRWAPGNTRLAFTSYSLGNPDIFLISLETNRRIPFPRYKGLNTTPAWSPDGK
ncbi:MAG: translocation protein TolB, partial [Acidobacteriia bacterium]|nr:translocation protein TolB [Terriglobia bacterium]